MYYKITTHGMYLHCCLMYSHNVIKYIGVLYFLCQYCLHVHESHCEPKPHARLRCLNVAQGQGCICHCLQDYPSIYQVRQLLIERDVIIVFATFGQSLSLYEVK